MSLKVEALTKEQWLHKVNRLSRKELINLIVDLNKKVELGFKQNTKMLQDIAFAQRKLLSYGFEWQPKFLEQKH